MKQPLIITFANQKGGVGKTSLCMAFANYLADKNHVVRVVDCDYQSSINMQRSADLVKYKDTKPPYMVLTYSLADSQGVADLIDRYRGKENVSAVLFDSPGNLREDGLVSLCVNSDYIVVPYIYDRLSIASTSRFVKFLLVLRERYSKVMKAKLAFVCNKYESSCGKKDEKLFWEKTEEVFRRLGIVTPRIAKYMNMTRLSTMFTMDFQQKIVKDCFDVLYANIFENQENKPTE